MMSNLFQNSYPSYINSLTLQTSQRVQKKFHLLRSFFGYRYGFLVTCAIGQMCLLTIVIYEFITCLNNSYSELYLKVQSYILIILFPCTLVLNFIIEKCFPHSFLRHRFIHFSFFMILIFSSNCDKKDKQFVPY